MRYANLGNAPSLLWVINDQFNVRAVMVNGEPQFMVEDVAKSLGCTDLDISLLARVPQEWRGHNPIITTSGLRDVLTLTGQGVYFFLSELDKLEVGPFREWIEWIVVKVVPSARLLKTGGTDGIFKAILGWDRWFVAMYGPQKCYVKVGD